MISSAAFAPAPEATSPVENLRRFSRVPLVLFGRCRILGMRPAPCHTKDVSAGGIAIFTPAPANVGALAWVALDKLGEFEGEIIRVFPGGFAIELAIGEAERTTLKRRLDWLGGQRQRLT